LSYLSNPLSLFGNVTLKWGEVRFYAAAFDLILVSNTLILLVFLAALSSSKFTWLGLTDLDLSHNVRDIAQLPFPTV
jgi:hypothetical protein